eukprot:3785677-Pyramimonas_sp.AAC.1
MWLTEIASPGSAETFLCRKVLVGLSRIGHHQGWVIQRDPTSKTAEPWAPTWPLRGAKCFYSFLKDRQCLLHVTNGPAWRHKRQQILNATANSAINSSAWHVVKTADVAKTGVRLVRACVLAVRAPALGLDCRVCIRNVSNTKCRAILEQGFGDREI